MGNEADPLPALERCRAADRIVLVQVQDLAGARAALAAPPDALIVQGNEASMPPFGFVAELAQDPATEINWASRPAW